MSNATSSAIAGEGQPAGEPYIILRGLSKSYGARDRGIGQAVFHEIDLEIFRHEFMTLFGPNGCGKTTLLKLIAGIDKDYQEGIITVGGQRPGAARVGFVFQDFQDSLFPWKTNLDNIAFPLEFLGVAKRDRRLRARQFLKRFQIDIPEDRFPYELSGGQRQLVAIARALLMEPEILILDEPFAHIDFEIRLALQLKLTAVWEVQRMTVLFVSHDVDEAALLGDRVVVLSGRPAAVRAVVVNPLPRPRCYDDLRDPVFFDLRSQILSAFGPEITT